MKLSAWFTTAYAALLMVGGIMGYLHAGSVVSLLTSFSFALFLIGSSISMFRGQITGQYTGLVYTLLLDAFFTYRFLKTKVFFPSGFMCLVSLGLVGILIFQIRRHPKKSFPN